MTGVCVCRMYDEVEKTASLRVSVGLSGPSSGASDGDGTMLLSGASSASARERKFGARAFSKRIAIGRSGARFGTDARIRPQGSLAMGRGVTAASIVAWDTWADMWPRAPVARPRLGC